MSGDDVRGSQPRQPDPRDAIDCAVVALGHLRGIYYFLSRSGEIRELKPRDMTALGLLSLFDGDGAWLHEHFAKLDKRDRKTGEIDVTAAAMSMMRRCADVGLYRADTPKRSLGVWRDDQLGDIAAHCGDFLVYFEKGKRRRRAAGIHLGHAIYTAAPPIDQPGKAASKEEARALLDRFRVLWRYGVSHLPLMVFGFTATAMLGSAPPWHPHILLTGEAGSGKSTLLKLVRAALGPQAVYVNDPSEAGLRERLSDEARTIVYDEAGKEGDATTFRVDGIIGLLRRMADEEGARSLRGSGAGAKEYAMAGSVALAAANPPILDAQDRSRILEIELLKSDPAMLPQVEAAIEAAEALSPALRARALTGWPRFLANLRVYRDALIRAKCDARQADQLGTLFAAAEMMLADDPAHADTVDAQIERLAAVIREHREIDAELSNANRCYGKLMTYQVEHWKGGTKSTLGRLIELGLSEEDGKSERGALPVYGVRLQKQLDGSYELHVANDHGGLDKVFAGTPWASGGWVRALRVLPGATSSDSSAWFAGKKSRFTIIPERYGDPPVRHLPDRPPPRTPVGAL